MNTYKDQKISTKLKQSLIWWWNHRRWHWREHLKHTTFNQGCNSELHWIKIVNSRINNIMFCSWWFWRILVLVMHHQPKIHQYLSLSKVRCNLQQWLILHKWSEFFWLLLRKSFHLTNCEVVHGPLELGWERQSYQCQSPRLAHMRLQHCSNP